MRSLRLSLLRASLLMSCFSLSASRYDSRANAGKHGCCSLCQLPDMLRAKAEPSSQSLTNGCKCRQLVFSIFSSCPLSCDLPWLQSFYVMQRVEIVLTAHPTQVNRRTLQYKHTRIATLLAQNDRCSQRCSISIMQQIACSSIAAQLILHAKSWPVPPVT